jgi:hypothetical protein
VTLLSIGLPPQLLAVLAVAAALAAGLAPRPGDRFDLALRVTAWP